MSRHYEGNDHAAGTRVRMHAFVRFPRAVCASYGDFPAASGEIPPGISGWRGAQRLHRSIASPMALPFTRDEFLEVFAAYNEALWPFAAALWLLTAFAFVLLLRAPEQRRLLTGLLAVHWAWTAVAYHLAFFTRINPAAWIFGAFFLVQAALFAWDALSARGLRFPLEHRRIPVPAAALIAYALAYPGIVQVGADAYPRIPTFGVPCPTTLLTIGFLLAAERRSFILALIPIFWSFIAGSAAVLLGMTADLALPIAGVLLALTLVRDPAAPALLRRGGKLRIGA